MKILKKISKSLKKKKKPEPSDTKGMPIVMTEGKFKGVIFSIDDIRTDNFEHDGTLGISYTIHHKPSENDFTAEEFEDALNQYVIRSIQEMVDREKQGALPDGKSRNDDPFEPDSQR